MNEKNKTLLLTFLYLLSSYLGVKLIPYEWMGPYESVHVWIENICLLFVMAFCIYEIRRQHLNLQKQISSLWFLPLLIGCFSNYIYLLIRPFQLVDSIETTFFIADTMETIISVVIEEIIFRGILLNLFYQLVERPKYKNLIVIILSAASFSLMHVINFYGNAPVTVLEQLAYTFLLGIVLSTIALISSHPLLVVILGHIAFNFFNNDLFSAYFDISFTWAYILTSLCIGIVCLVYLFIVYNKVYCRKRDS